MFTLEQIDEIHSRFGRADTLVQYLRALNGIGITRSESFITDGHTVYYGCDGFSISSNGVHAMLDIADTSNRDALKKHLVLHKEGKTNYFEMSKELAESGVEKWVFDTTKLSLAYYDKLGNTLLIETIE